MRIFRLICFVFLAACANNKADKEVTNSQNKDTVRTELQYVTDAPTVKKEKLKNAGGHEFIESLEIDTINEFTVKEGNVIRIYTKEDTLVFESKPDLEERMEVFEYKEFNRRNKFHVICAQYWESYHCYMVNHMTSQIDSIWQAPTFSPNDSSLISKLIDYGLEGAPNGFQVWQLIKDKGWVKILEVDQQKWIPVSFQWLSNDSLSVKAVTVEHFELKDWNYDSLTEFQNIKFGIEK